MSEQTVERWIAKYSYGRFACAKVRFRETDKMLIVKDHIEGDPLTAATGHLTRISKTDPDHPTFETRREALQRLIDQREKAIAKHEQQIAEDRAVIAKIAALDAGLKVAAISEIRADAV